MLLYFSSCKGNHSVKVLPPDTAAFGAAHFGMTKKDYNDKLKGDTIIVIENTVFTLKPYFIPKDKRLYALRLLSADQPHEQFKIRLIADMNTMVQQMVNLYGGPTQYFNQPKAEELQPKQIEWYCFWNNPKKEIKIGIAQLKTDDRVFRDTRRYMAVCQIVNKPLQQVAHSQLIYLDLNAPF